MDFDIVDKYRKEFQNLLNEQIFYKNHKIMLQINNSVQNLMNGTILTVLDYNGTY